MKRIILLISLFILTFSLNGCGKSNNRELPEDIRNVDKNGNETQVLNSVNADIYEGDFTVIMGASGAGKSTLLYALSGMDSITDGVQQFGKLY